MASIEYAKDMNGKKVSAEEASCNLTYQCPYCLDSVNVRKGNVYVDYFAHIRIKDRTPFQKICPGYKGNEYSSINNTLDKMYINNGGVPLYLCSENERFELRAYFPTLSDSSMMKLKEVNAKICVNTKAVDDMDRGIYNVDNLHYYKVDTLREWIDIKCEPNVHLPEMQRKWLWGIRGIDLNNDIYHCNKDGGYRVALKANISVGKTYRIIFENCNPIINGIKFTELGNIQLNQGYLNNKIIFSVYSMELNLYTEEARKFIERKGYNLLDGVNELLPLWPPAVFEGNELKYDHSNALFLHIDNTNKERVYYTHDNGLMPVSGDTKSAIIKITINDNKTVAVAGTNGNIIEEIKYSIIRVDNLVKKDLITLKSKVTDSDDNIFDFTNKYLKPPKDGILMVNSNLHFTAIVLNENYVISSSNVRFDKVRSFDELVINNKAFGICKYKYKKKNDKTNMLELNFEKVYLHLYVCTAPTINTNERNIELLYLLSKNIHNNIRLYRLIELWVKTNRIPVSAVKQLEEIRIYLGGRS
ncbi:hypothetical protein LL033_01165 [Clostridium estertheticum]|uniref:hypothetical protein n=1 Tax=Clostridium estertheticum TaxID=238834 RepID=UPI001C0E6A36|nr:hypothetical protein [Clostridium estertheticum]MBU3218188.1 hypothetical protein [Clostridium estertheticum]WAG55877.1 hypothetical protein LL033_01165 [Clostridium estertheticum]